MFAHLRTTTRCRQFQRSRCMFQLIRCRHCHWSGNDLRRWRRCYHLRSVLLHIKIHRIITYILLLETLSIRLCAVRAPSVERRQHWVRSHHQCTCGQWSMVDGRWSMVEPCYLSNKAAPSPCLFYTTNFPLSPWNVHPSFASTIKLVSPSFASSFFVIH